VQFLRGFLSTILTLRGEVRAFVDGRLSQLHPASASAQATLPARVSALLVCWRTIALPAGRVNTRKRLATCIRAEPFAKLKARAAIPLPVSLGRPCADLLDESVAVE